MSHGPDRTRAIVLLTGTLFVMTAAAVSAQRGPVAAMFNDDQERDASRASSFLMVNLPATKAAGFPVHVYLSAGDLERAFDRSDFRPDAAIVPTNTELLITAPAPATQRVLIDRVQKQADVMRDLEDQIAIRRKQASAVPGDEGLLRIALDTFVLQLARPGISSRTTGAFPKTVCLIATNFASGGAIDHRELFAQDRLRKGIASCLAALDAAGAQSLVLPLMGAASSGTQGNDAFYEGQRILMECRMINATAGIALGIHDFAGGRRNLREIGVVQWDREIDVMFKMPSGTRAAESARTAYQSYAEQISEAFRRGLSGARTTVSDLNGSCGAVLIQ
jgi:hypothetical protein